MNPAHAQDPRAVAAYLTVGEAAVALGVADRTVRRRVMCLELPALVLAPSLIRIEAVALVPGAPPPIPEDCPVEITCAWLADHLRLHRYTVMQLAREKRIPMRMVPPGRWVMTRRELAGWLADATKGEGGW